VHHGILRVVYNHLPTTVTVRWHFMTIITNRVASIRRGQGTGESILRCQSQTLGVKIDFGPLCMMRSVGASHTQTLQQRDSHSPGIVL
jgi:hypothetical protein